MAGRLLDAGCPLVEINAGGGLGTPTGAGEAPLDLDAYAAILARRFGGLGVAVGTEPGEFLANECGVLLAEVVTVERRLGERFVGLDAGWNVMNDAYIYGREPAAIVAARADAPRDDAVTLAGNINEGDDVFARGRAFARVEEGEIVAFVSVGGYCPGMWTDHCLRPRAATLYFSDRL
jgi:diaminopimelate decarboxylase